ncbi:unnamed protein product [Adineta steineri]|uniref:ubiquitinyl hydrolase 1 n=1 Tax=Adineta steineri TaxID=433720 RepID=A0A818TZA3_9BILA|nr:unnamed protein product [Adineta steineri]CAF1307031.1 unnamed protein product [Adineta steineri]CAF3649838.1 unnamed protein product [Adineta steineri]CAF3688930.1 unnamed protein product [Adineta steineri]CAF3807439.1 unnamed protein product [Adineta steineri]
MTIFSSKKPSNSNKDLSSNSTNQQQQQQSSSSNISRTRLSRDDENTNNIIQTNSSEESNLVCENNLPSTSSLTTNTILTTITTAPVSKRKSHYHHQTTVKQARRRGGSVGEKLISNSSVTNVTCNSSPSTSLTNENNISSNTNSNEHLTQPSTSTSSLTTVNNDEQCNSEDEYEQTAPKYDRNNLTDLEMRFARALKEKKGFVIKPVQEDGACLFRAVSDQVFGDEEMHATVRQNCMDYIVKNADFFGPYITEDFDHYITRKRLQHCHGNHIEMIALSEIYNRPIEVYEYSIEPINIVHGMYKTDNEPIRLSYHCSVHYNSIIDPWRPTAGHGLGFPDLEPGRAQETLIRSAVRQSEESHIERAMLDDKIAATDWEATQDELIQQVARESYLQWLCDTKQQHKDNKTMPSSSSSPTSTTTSERALHNNHASSPKNLLPLRLDERKDCEFALPFNYECDASSNPDLDDDDSYLRQVLAISQIEYVETLKKQQQPPKSDDPDGPSSSSDTHLL